MTCSLRCWLVPALLIVLVAPMLGAANRDDGLSPTPYRNPNNDCAPAPLVFNTPYHQSPVRADPDDLLMIPGYGFQEGAVVVYRRLHNLNPGIGPPPTPPSNNNAAIGRLDIVDLPGATPDGYNNIPDSLAARLPKVMSKGRTYGLWVKNPGSCWSEPILINDARPLWLTPDLAYETTELASLPRELKVVGRNLDPMRIKNTLVRLSGPFTYTLPAVSAGDDHPLNHYVARVTLPKAIRRGEYNVQVSRDGINWVPVASNTLTVLPDPPAKPFFALQDFGCLPDDGLDDAACIDAASDAAAAAGGGVIHFSAGQWDVIEPASVPSSHQQGIVIHNGVDLIGDGTAVTTVVKSSRWVKHTLFTLMGHNKVREIHFTEDIPDASPANPDPAPTVTTCFRLGRIPGIDPTDPLVADRFAITDSRITKMNSGIVSSGRPISHLYVVDNELQAYKDDLKLAGNRNIKDIIFDVSDSVIAHNLFLPGDYIDVAGHQGVIASQIGATTRVDFSQNVADGTVNGGWRATHFFHMNGNHEMLLMSQNLMSCTGDKAGDGEALIFDQNQNVMGFSSMREVRGGSGNSVTVEGTWKEDTPGFYDEHWVQIVDGPGVGQSRKITSYTTLDPQPVIQVSPDWDVAPVAGASKITVQRVFWNTYMVDNEVDIRAPCLKSNANEPDSGVMGWAATAIDSTIEGNRLYEGNGITAHGHYRTEDSLVVNFIGTSSFLVYSGEIRNNHVEGEYDFSDSRGGINVHYGTVTDMPCPVVGYNLAISHNTVIQADAGRIADPPQAGINFYKTWLRSEITPYNWKAPLIYHNHIEDVDVGIMIEDTWTHNTVLYGNTFTNVGTPLVDNGTNTAVLP